MYDSNAATTASKLFQINYCIIEETLFEEIKTKTFWLKTFLLNTFVVALVAGSQLEMLYKRRENFWVVVVKRSNTF